MVATSTPRPHPTPPPRTSISTLLRYKRDPVRFMMDNFRMHGDIVSYNLLGRTYWQLNHPDDMRQIFLTQADKVQKSALYKGPLAKYLGNGLLISDGAYWKRQRQLVQPAFHHSRVQEYAELMVTYTHDLLAEWDSTIDIYAEMNKLTLYIVVKTLFNADIRQEAAEIGELTVFLQDTVIGEMVNPLRFPDWVPTSHNRRKKASIDRLNEIVQGVIAERRASGEDQGDLLSMLLQSTDAEGERMTDREVRDEALTIFLAGYDTTANALGWAFYLLGRHPEILERLYAEIDGVLGDRAATLADLQQLPYVEMVVKEVLRLYPSAWAVGREALEEITLPRLDFAIPKGDSIQLPIYVVHHDERWFPDPENFNPLRFTSENEKQRLRHTYIPFIYGPRVCIGNGFAMLEAQLILTTVLQQFRIKLKPDQQVTMRATTTLAPEPGVMVDLERR